MKLTEKDKTFLETLKRLMESKDLWVELKTSQPSYMALRGTYGDKVYRAFRMTRQGVRWRFWRIYNDIYISAFEAILFIETTYSTSLRENAIRISKERYALRQERATRFESVDASRPEPKIAANSRISKPNGAHPSGGQR